MCFVTAYLYYHQNVLTSFFAAHRTHRISALGQECNWQIRDFAGLDRKEGAS